MPEDKEDFGRRKEDGLELSGPYGLKAKFSGDKVIVIIILIAGVCFLAYMLRDHDIRNQAQVASIKTDVSAVADKMEEITYVLTLPEAERKALKLDMPTAMRRKIREARNNE